MPHVERVAPRERFRRRKGASRASASRRLAEIVQQLPHQNSCGIRPGSPSRTRATAANPPVAGKSAVPGRHVATVTPEGSSAEPSATVGHPW